MSNVNLLTMRNPHGSSIIIHPGQADQERDTFLCVHCGRHRRIKAQNLSVRPEFCYMCDGPHCDTENCWVCVPFEKRMEAYERRTVFSASLTRMLL